MALNYPVGIQDFREIREGNYLYIDKTAYVQHIVYEGKFFFISRPRRFGKSLFISTLEHLFKGDKTLFENLYIEDKWNWAQTNPVIKISFAAVSHKEKGLFNAIHERLDEIALEYDVVIEDNSISAKFRKLIETLSKKHGKVVVLIDEYDKPIIDYLGIDTAKAIENREIFKSFYSILKDSDPYLKLVFITGVSKFSRVSIFSDLNNLTDISSDRTFANCCGITQEELESSFKEELKIYPKEKIKAWYNGYSWDLQTSVYNPFSLLHFFRTGDFKNFWFESGTPTFLINLTKEQHLYDFQEVRISQTQLNSFQLENLQTIPLMFQTGYLTLKGFDEDERRYILGFPNQEVRDSYIEMLADSYIQNNHSLDLALQLRNALRNYDLDKLERIFNSLFKSLPYTLWQKENEHFYHAIIHLTFRLLGIYVDSEIQTSDGRIDALVKLEKYIYCFEFKLDESAEIALQQIIEKEYLSPYLYQNKTCIAIGVNFSKENKKIEKILWHEITQP